MENKNNLNEIFSEFKSETSDILLKSIKIININSSNNTSSFIQQKGGFNSLTSISNNNNITKLINMLISDSVDNNYTNSKIYNK